jgi:Glycosyl hydrolase catalytic core
MVEMARRAKLALRRVNLERGVNNMLIAPSITTSGLSAMEQFLRTGGAQYVDIINFHYYYSAQAPENVAYTTSNVQALMHALRLDSKPLWITEGAVADCTARQGTCANSDQLTDLGRGASTRALMTMWTNGVRNFDYYYWEGYGPYAALVEAVSTPKNCVAHNPALIAFNANCPTQLGIAYRRDTEWLGKYPARLVDGYRVETTAGSGVFVYVFKIELAIPDAFTRLVRLQPAAMLWTTGKPVNVLLPDDRMSRNFWSSLTIVNVLKALPSTVIPGDRTLTLSNSPVLLTSGRWFH